MATRILIPCRRASTRFPDKALAPILGKPSIQWVVEACEATGIPTTLINDDWAISGGPAQHTITREDYDARNGTERCCLAVRDYGADGLAADRYIIVAGDEITVTPEQITRFADACPPHMVGTILTEQGTADAVTTCATRYREVVEFVRKPLSATKTACGIYHYPAAILRAYKDMPVLGFEQVYDIELSRVLHNGFPVYAHVDNSHSGLGLNYPADVPKIEAWLQNNSRPA